VRRLLYIDCVGGVAGDMLLAALVDAGADLEEVRSSVRELGVSLETDRVDRGSISARRLQIDAPAETARRTWKDVRQLIDELPMPAGAVVRAQAAFAALAQAEAAVHGIEAERVHFHEVGALDSIVDICGVAMAIESLSIDQVQCSPLPLGRGFVSTAHGTLPLPAPATLELLRGAPIVGVEMGEELVTPTGAALVASLSNRFGMLPEMKLTAIGYGAGSRSSKSLPNVVRVLTGEATSDDSWAQLSVLETNLDDFTPELIPGAVEACFGAGAVDVWTAPITMKHGRPGLMLSSAVRPGGERDVAEAMVRTTSALGVRWRRLDRMELEREWRTVAVADEPVRVKIGILDGEIVNLAPEHRDCADVAARTGMTEKAVWTIAMGAASDLMGGS
jgi:pyridinium-3,5-bisthiocarboxylic acid mononucleotide nickel chelatase